MIIGRLTQDVETKELPSGTQVATMSVATNRVYKDRAGENRSETEFHRIVAWGKLAELCKAYLAKGRLVFIEGRIQYRSWLTPTGEKRTTTEIVADNVRFGPKGTSTETSGESQSNSSTQTDGQAPAASSSKGGDEAISEDLEPQSDTFEIPY